MRTIKLNDAANTELEVSLFSFDGVLLWLTLKNKDLTFTALAELFDNKETTNYIQEFRDGKRYEVAEGYTELIQINKTNRGIDIGLRKF